MPLPMLSRWSRYGSRAPLATAAAASPTGRHFGADLYEAEVRYLVEHEFARTAEDVLWRRSKIGLRLSATEQAGVADFLTTLPRLRLSELTAPRGGDRCRAGASHPALARLFRLLIALVLVLAGQFGIVHRILLCLTERPVLRNGSGAVRLCRHDREAHHRLAG
jgi:hypothetical protein